MLTRVFRELGAQVRFKAFLKDMNVGVSATDDRRIEVLAQDLPCFGGSQLAVDITLRSALRCSGEPQPGAADIDGATWTQARRDKEATYPELVGSNRCRLVVVALETGGRWSEEAVDVFRQLAFPKAQEVPPAMKWSVVLAWERRWTCMFVTTCTVAFEASLVAPSEQCETWCRKGGEAPTLVGLLDDVPRKVSRDFVTTVFSVSFFWIFFNWSQCCFFCPVCHFLFCSKCRFFFCPVCAFFCPGCNFLFCVDNRLLILSRFRFFCPVTFFCPNTRQYCLLLLDNVIWIQHSSWPTSTIISLFRVLSGEIWLYRDSWFGGACTYVTGRNWNLRELFVISDFISCLW